MRCPASVVRVVDHGTEARVEEAGVAVLAGLGVLAAVLLGHRDLAGRVAVVARVESHQLTDAQMASQEDVDWRNEPRVQILDNAVEVGSGPGRPDLGYVPPGVVDDARRGSDDAPPQGGLGDRSHQEVCVSPVDGVPALGAPPAPDPLDREVSDRHGHEGAESSMQERMNSCGAYLGARSASPRCCRATHRTPSSPSAHRSSRHGRCRSGWRREPCGPPSRR